MKASIIRFAGVLSLLLIIICCSEKKDDNEQKDIIAWIKPCLFKNGVPALNSLSVKSDQGFLLSGFIFHDIEYHGVVINMNSNGDTIWSKQIDIEGYNQCKVYYAVEKSADEIIITGLLGVYTGPRFIMWLDGNGNLKKKIILPLPPGYDCFDGKLFLLANGNICLASFSQLREDMTPASANLRLDLFDSEGLSIDSSFYPNTFSTSDKIIQMNDGNMAITGSTWPGGSLDNIEMVFVLTDPSGKLIHRQEFGSDSFDAGESVCTDFKNGYCVSGSQTYNCTPVIYPINSSGEVGTFTSVADTIHSYGTLLKKANEGYLMFIQGSSRLYFIKLDKDLKSKYITFIDYHNYPVGFASMYLNINLMKDGSFAFLYISDLVGTSLFKTKPV